MKASVGIPSIRSSINKWTNKDLKNVCKVGPFTVFISASSTADTVVLCLISPPLFLFLPSSWSSAKPISLVERCWCRSTLNTVPQRSIKELKFLHTPNCPFQVMWVACKLVYALPFNVCFAMGKKNPELFMQGKWETKVEREKSLYGWFSFFVCFWTWRSQKNLKVKSQKSFHVSLQALVFQWCIKIGVKTTKYSVKIWEHLKQQSATLWWMKYSIKDRFDAEMLQKPLQDRRVTSIE